MPAAKEIPGYRALHSRLARWLGPASEYLCVACGGPATEWAFDHADPEAIDSPLGVYSLDPDHYWAMCRSCHWQLDRASQP